MYIFHHLLTSYPKYLKHSTFSSCFWSIIIVTGDGCLEILTTFVFSTFISMQKKKCYKQWMTQQNTSAPVPIHKQKHHDPKERRSFDHHRQLIHYCNTQLSVLFLTSPQPINDAPPRLPDKPRKNQFTSFLITRWLATWRTHSTISFTKSTLFALHKSAGKIIMNALKSTSHATWPSLAPVKTLYQRHRDSSATKIGFAPPVLGSCAGNV